MDEVSVIAHIHRVSKDKEGEVTLVLKVPKIYQFVAMNLPDETNFKVIFKKYEEYEN